MFLLQAEPLDADALRRALVRPSGGALVVFEGTVRDHNGGRAVVALEYEGAAALAEREFARLEAEMREQFDFLQVTCIHRVGRLKPGETAVWIGVTSVHRSAAFAACQYVINELKKRLPIWKKEYYADGDSGWINAP
jgi:molybdopterin synthase catalytic subunit